MTDLTRSEISGFEQLREACTRFHDVLFDLDASKFDPSTNTWTGKFLRPVEDPGRISKARHYLVLTRYYFPVVETTLRLSGVRKCEVRDRAAIGTYTFCNVDPTDAGCRLVFNQDLEIDLELEGQPHGEIRDERELPGRGYITSLLFIEFGFKME